jgi:2'-5' RNA ligase
VIQNGEQVRSFIAIELPRNIKRELEQIQYKIKQGGYAGIKWVNPEGIHVTLKFLGNISSEQIIEISKVLDEATQEMSLFHLEIASLGAFPNLRQPRVLWVAINGEIAKLSRLQQRIDSLLTSCGFLKESRPFVPHLTLARLKDSISPEEKRKIGVFIKSLQLEADFPFDAKAVSLMRSQLMLTGAVYSCLFTAKLGSN